MSDQEHTLDLGKHVLTVCVSDEGRRTTAVLEVDGVEVARRTGWPAVRLPLGEIDGLEGVEDRERSAVAVSAWRAGRATCQLVVRPASGGFGRPEKRMFEPPAGTRAHRRYLWAEAHPRLYAARHVAVAVTRVVAGLVLARLALDLVLHLGWGWLPDWSPPRIWRPNLPDVSWPHIPWPDIDIPDWSLPGWLVAVLATKKYWFPILVAIAVAVSEVKRRQRRQAEAEQSSVGDDGGQTTVKAGKEDAEWPAPSTPSDTPRDASSSSMRD